MKRPRKSWVITDTHLNHQKLVDMGERPNGFEKLIIKGWQYVVAEQDVVYHLGDVIIGRESELGDYMAMLPGKKILIRGNHDHHKPEWYEARGFDAVFDAVLVDGIYLTHTPQAVLPEGALVNVHGHLHRGTHRGCQTDIASHCRWLACEKQGYAPVELYEFAGVSA